jgi:hypothetical protein
VRLSLEDRRRKGVESSCEGLSHPDNVVTTSRDVVRRVVRILDRQEVRLVRSVPTFVVFVVVPSSTFQCDSSFVEIEVFAVVLEELDEE